MKVRRLRWHGAGRQLALANWLRLELGAWLDEWSVDPTLLTLRIADVGMSHPSGWRWMRATSKSGSIVLGTHAAALDGVGGLLAKATHDDALGLGRRVGMRALRALLTRFVGGTTNLIGIDDANAPDDESHDSRFGGCWLLLQGAGFEAQLYLDNALFEFWVHPQQFALPTLMPRESALGTERVTLDVVLDLGNARLADTHQLQIGDVLVSSTTIDSFFHLALPDSRRLVAANLVRKDGRRALQVDDSSLRKVS